MYALVMFESVSFSYSNPVANTAEIPSFRFDANCKRHIANIGSSKIKKSEIMLTAPLAKYATLKSIHWPPTCSGFQILS